MAQPYYWIPLSDKLPDMAACRMVLIYTQGFSVHGLSTFIVAARDLNEASFIDPEDQPWHCRMATHWMNLPDYNGV